MKNKNKRKMPVPSIPDGNPEKKFNFKRLILLILNTALVFGVYQICMRYYYFEIVLWIYLALTAALAFSYVIYNRGFTQKGVTEEMLPDEWNAEKKKNYIEGAKSRLEKSKWMLMWLIPFIFTFAFDTIELFVFPYFSSLFS